MAAAAWTRNAKNITGDPDSWTDYLSVEALSVAIGLSKDTITDTLTRRINDPTDPRIAIVQPAVRIGPTALNAIPRWTQDQADEYLRLRDARDLGGRAERRKELPRYNPTQAKRAGLAGTRDLADLLGCAENTIRWWARAESGSFPPEVGIAAREGDATFGPPRGLRKIAAVRKWVNSNPERIKRLKQSQTRRAAEDAKGDKPTADTEGVRGGRKASAPAA